MIVNLTCSEATAKLLGAKPLPFGVGAYKLLAERPSICLKTENGVYQWPIDPAALPSSPYSQDGRVR